MKRLELVWISFFWIAIGCGGARSERPDAAPAAARTGAGAASSLARGLALAERGDPLRAEQYLTLALRAGHDPAEVIVPLVRVCVASGRLRTALSHAQPFLRRHPEVWQLRYLVAAIHAALQQPALALRELRLIAAQHPRAAQAHYLLGVTLRDGLGDLATARASFQTYLRLAPDGERAAEVATWLAQHSPPRDPTQAAANRLRGAAP